ncbi:AAA family ATPase [Myxococcus dinghuensis]|uniref:AAA family ATPase n=1 Tax=Myxococcus dinghuensis TaxID=2906761 RepID=UPI00225DE29A|nr:AAA family ATPase [Myxococcus dinghuensis]
MKPGLRIDALRVRRFGHFSEFSLQLGPGLHLLYGPNEAGKSTLLAFLRGMLFGFERRGHPERYEPAEDIPFGGELQVSTSTGPLCIRRTATPRGRRSESVSVLGPDGEPVSEERLKDARGHVSRELFFDVFAFRLEELAGFEQLTREQGASEALVAASMRGARRLPEALAAFRKSAEQLFKPNGTNPELNVKLRELEEVQEQLRQEGDRPALYFAKKDRLEALGVEHLRLEAEVDAADQEVGRLARLEAALGDVTALAEARAELATLPTLETFPEGGEARLDDTLHRSRGYHAEAARLAERLKTTQAELERLSLPSPVRGREEALRLVVAAYAERSELLRALPARRATLEAKRRQVEVALAELGLGIDGPALLALDLSAGARAGLETLAARLDSVDASRREVSSTLTRARVERERLDGVLTRMDAELATLPEARPAQVRQQQAGLARMRAVRVELERLGEQREDVHRQVEGLRAPSEPPPVSAVLPVWWVPVAALVAVVLAVAAWLLGGAAVAVLALVGGLLLTGVLELARRRVEAAHEQQHAAHASRQQGRQREEERLRSTLMSLSAREEMMHRELLVSASEAGISPASTVADMTARENVLADALEKAGRRDALTRERETLLTTHDLAVREERQAAEHSREFDARHAVLVEELASHLAARHFPASLPAPAALALWRDAAALRQRLLDVGTDEAALAVDEETCSTVVTRLREAATSILGTAHAEDSHARHGETGLAAAESLPSLAPHSRRGNAGLASAKPLDLVPHSRSDEAGLASTEALASLSTEVLAARVKAELEAARERETERRALEERRRELREEKARLDTLCRSEEAALSALLAEGGGGDEETFRRRAVQAHRYAELSARVRELSLRIEARTGLQDTETREALRALGGEEGLREELGRLRVRHADAQRQLKDVLTERGATRNQLEQWENDDLLVRLRIQEESLRAKVAELATRYAKDRLVLALLNRARRRFEEEQQPRVVQLASEHFAQLTDGRYRRVFIPASDDRELRVSDGQRDWSAAQLSRGTREQLFLAFRLAVVRDFGETRGALPLIVDDVLVNFDPGRARSAIQLLARLSEQQQVIAFTCHPWLRESFLETGAQVHLLSPQTDSTQPATPSTRRAG